MIVTCEKCHTKFQLTEKEKSLIKKSGRIMKCGNCHHMWLVGKDNNHNNQLEILSHSPTDKNLIDSLKEKHEPALTLMNIAPPEKQINNYEKYATQPISLKIIFYSLIFFTIFSISVTKKDFLIQNVPIVRTILVFMGH